MADNAEAPQDFEDDFAKLAAIGAEMATLAVRTLAQANAFSPQALEHIAGVHVEMAEMFERAGNGTTAQGYRGFAADLREKAKAGEQSADR